MTVDQISIFIQNKQGKLAELTRLMGDNQIDLIALSIADTADFGIVRAIVNDTQKAMDVLRAADYTLNLTQVAAVVVEDTPGGLARVLEILDARAISVEYIYSFVRAAQGQAVLIIRVREQEQAAQALKHAGVRLLTQAEVSAL